jgi:hypothetical protein
MQQITFTAANLRELTAQIREFLGDEPSVSASATTAPAAPVSKHPPPDWAPPGSAWLEMPGAPVLIGPDGVVVPVKWDGAKPTPGVFTVNHDAAADAAGAALLASIRG